MQITRPLARRPAEGKRSGEFLSMKKTPASAGATLVRYAGCRSFFCNAFPGVATRPVKAVLKRARPALISSRLLSLASGLMPCHRKGRGRLSPLPCQVRDTSLPCPLSAALRRRRRQERVAALIKPAVAETCNAERFSAPPPRPRPARAGARQGRDPRARGTGTAVPRRAGSRAGDPRPGSAPGSRSP